MDFSIFPVAGALVADMDAKPERLELELGGMNEQRTLVRARR
jgi:hypothetical protein